MQNDPLAAGQLINNRYTVVELVGEGAYGAVYLARDAVLGSDLVALKLLEAEIGRDPRALARLRDEVTLVQSIRSDHVVRVFNLEESNGRYLLTMEYIDGSTLRARMTTELSLEQRIAVLRDIACGLSAVHRMGIIHRDIKPENILFTREGVLKLADFGIARPTERTERLTKTGAGVGTPYYMSPEAFTGKAIDARADIYSFGVVAYELLTGSRPFDGASYFEVAEAHLTAEVPAISTTLRLPLWLRQLVYECLSKRPERRPQRIEEIERLLQKGAQQPRRPALLLSRLGVGLIRRWIERAWSNRRMLQAATFALLFLMLISALRKPDWRPHVYAAIFVGRMEALGFPTGPLRRMFNVTMSFTDDAVFDYVALQRTAGVEALLASGISARARNEDGVDLLEVAVRLGDAQTIRTILRYTSAVSYTKEEQRRLVFEALAIGKWSTAKALIDHGFAADGLNGDGDSSYGLFVKGARHALGARFSHRILANQLCMLKKRCIPPDMPDGKGKTVRDHLLERGYRATLVELEQCEASACGAG